MKIVSRGKVLNSSEFYKKKKRRRNIKIALVLGGFIAILVGIVYLARYEKMLVVEVVVESEDVFDRKEIIEMTEEILSGYYLWLIPRTNALLLPRSEIKENLYRAFPRLESVDLSLNGLNSLSVYIEEREPHAMYCVDEVECYFIDQGAVIFARAPTFTEQVYLTYTTESELIDFLGKRLVTLEEFDSLGDFMEKLTGLNINPTQIYIGISNYELIFSTGGKLIWSKESDPLAVFNNLNAFMLSEPIRREIDFLERVLQLDLTTDNKVFYKFK